MNIIIVGCHKGLTRGVVKSLINQKINFSFIGTKEIIRSVSLSKLCKASYEIGEKEFEIYSKNLLDIIKTFIKENDTNFVIPTGIRSTLYISKHARVIEGIENNYPISDYKTLTMLNNKWDFYLFLKKHNISSPKTMLFDSAKIKDIMRKQIFPVITKPLDSENSNNVVKVDNFEELYNQRRIVNLPLLVQEYIPGYDINLCIFSSNGRIKSWTINRRTDTGILFDNNKDILKIGEKIVKVLNFSGLIHFDLRFNELDGTVSVIECNPRVWGSMLHSTYVGVNFLEQAINNQNKSIYFNEIQTGTISLNKDVLLKKLIKASISWKDFKSIFTQIKLFLLDPIYEINFFINNK
jgi:predicted ATP-grasp superfamily ATP-dependent carboligase